MIYDSLIAGLCSRAIWAKIPKSSALPFWLVHPESMYFCKERNTFKNDLLYIEILTNWITNSILVNASCYLHCHRNLQFINSLSASLWFVNHLEDIRHKSFFRRALMPGIHITGSYRQRSTSLHPWAISRTWQGCLYLFQHNNTPMGVG